MPDVLISSGGALVKYGTEYIYKADIVIGSNDEEGIVAFITNHIRKMNRCKFALNVIVLIC